MVKLLYFNKIILLITQSHVFVIQANSSFKCLGIHTTPTYATPIIITEVLPPVTYIQLF